MYLPHLPEVLLQFWAPELHRINNVWYVYYTAGTSSDLSSQRTWVIENASVAPLPVVGKQGQIYIPPEFLGIDGSVFQLQAKNYFIWSGYSEALNTVQRITLRR